MVKQVLKERRNWVRAKRILSIQYRLCNIRKGNVEKSWNLSTTEDMSMGGLSFYTDHEYRANDILELQVIMSGILNIYRGYGKVVRVERKRMGACFFVAVKFMNKKLKSKSSRTDDTIKKSKVRNKKRI